MGMLVAPSQIASQLTAFWEKLESANKIRASLFNLIIYTQGNSRSDYLHTIAKRVIEKFPSRVIFLTKVEDSIKEIETRVSVLSSSDKQSDVACDYIEITVPKSRENEVSFLLLPHILPDLPIYVLWAEDPLLNNPLSKELERLASRMIFDSESTSSLQAFANNLLQRKKESSCDIADLNWARTESWRTLLSAFFHTPEKLSKIQNAKTISFSYNSFSSPFLQKTQTPSLYLQGWIASQLGWKCRKIETSKEPTSLTYQGNKEVQVSLKESTYPSLPSGNILSCEILTYDNEHFSFTRSLTHPQQITLSSSSETTCELPLQYLFTKSESGHSLVKEISHSGTSTHYTNLLHLLTTTEYKNV